MAVFKCGPDFLDPHWLTLASGHPAHQLDLWMNGEADCAKPLHAAVLDFDLIIVEGVMGLFDRESSAADLAQRFDLPVLTVNDASAMDGTFGALAWGLQHYREGLRFAGVLANRVASEGQALMLEEGLRDRAQWQGALMRSDAFTLPERHLGLVMASELSDAIQRLDAAADALAETPLGKMSAEDLQAWSVAFEDEPEALTLTLSQRERELLAGQTIAVARDAAFCFIYAANIDCVQAMGAQIVYFSPLHEGAMPACDAVWLPGGCPELHAEKIVANTTMKASIAAHLSAGKPVWAECGSMMAMFETLTTSSGASYPMWGVLPGSVTLQKRLAALGPRQLEVSNGVLRGHAFHYSTCATKLLASARTQAAPGRKLRGHGEALHVQGSVKASYFHAWFASCPETTAALFLKDQHAG